MFKLNPLRHSREAVPVTVPAALAITEGSLYTYSLTTGVLAAVSNTTVSGQAIFLATASYAASAAITSVPMQVVTQGDVYSATSANNTNVAHNGQRMLFSADGLKLTNSGTDAPTGVFTQIAVVGAAADKTVKVIVA